LLEKAGITIKKIKSHSHNLSELLKEIGNCEIHKELSPSCSKWIRATEIRSITIDSRFSNATAGNLLTAESKGASVYSKPKSAMEISLHIIRRKSCSKSRRPLLPGLKHILKKSEIAQPGA